jgi:hypothetical protein
MSNDGIYGRLSNHGGEFCKAKKLKKKGGTSPLALVSGLLTYAIKLDASGGASTTSRSTLAFSTPEDLVPERKLSFAHTIICFQNTFTNSDFLYKMSVDSAKVLKTEPLVRIFMRLY